MPSLSDDPEVVRAQLRELLDARDGVRTVFQPLVDMVTGRPTAVEALTRGPSGHPLERPDLLFAAARRCDLTTELDWHSRMTALRTALDAGAAAPMSLFLNAEPEALASTPPDGFLALVDEVAAAGVRVVLEVTERALAARPAELLHALDTVRSWGWAIAVDDVGAERASLALLPFLAPDVIKLDLRLVQQRTTVDVAEIVNAVLAQAERSGALVLAEGIETEEHAGLATAMGATLGQGWLYGRPGPLHPTSDWLPLRLSDAVPPMAAGTPWEQVRDVLPVRRSTKPLLIAMSKTLERQALANGEAAVVLGTFQSARHFTPSTHTRYATLAGSAAFVAALAEGLSARPAAGVRGSSFASDDPLAAEWDLAVIGPHFAAALVAHDLGDAGPDSERRFDYTLTYQRDLVLRVASSLMARITPEPTDAEPLQLAPPAPALVAALAHLPEPDLLLRSVQSSSSGVTIADARHPDHPLVYVNPAFERLSGYSAEQALGRNCRFMQGPGSDPEAVAAMRSAVRHGRHLRTLLRNRRPDGTYWWNEITLNPVHDSEGEVTHFIGLQTDATARVEAERRLAHLVGHDALTGLVNRAGLLRQLGVELDRSRRSGTSTALLSLDVDGFQRVNDAFGHEVGDDVLQQVAARLRAAVRPGDVLARLGADAFAVLLPGLRTDSQQAQQVCIETVGRLQAALDGPVVVGGQQVSLTVSVGAAVHTGDDEQADQLLTRADRERASGKRSRRHLEDVVRG